jgi:predicted RNase H-like nuclease (RuvC/YqgF family)
VKEEIIEETYSKEHKHDRKGKKPKIYIDLNRSAYVEENQSVDRAETQIEPRKQGIEEFQMTIKELKQENKSLEVWNGKLQERVQRLKEKHKSQRELLKKVRKMNIKLYWSNVVLKTKLQQEKGQSSSQQ